MKLHLFAFALIAAGLATAAAAQSSLEKMKQMRVATTDLNLPAVPQTGTNADAIRNNLRKVKLPPGFKIELYAIVPDARHMAVANSTNMLFVGTRKTTVWAVTDRNSDGVADEVKPFAPSLNFKQPNGVCWTKDGFLIVVEHNRVLNFPAAEFFYEGPDVAVIEVVPQGQLIPVEEESYNHGARTCRVADDGKLYITLGQPYNVQPRTRSPSTRSSASAASSAWTRSTAAAARSTPAACAISVGIDSQPEGQDRSGSPTTRPTAWATTRRRRIQPPDPGRRALRLPVVQRTHQGHRRGGGLQAVADEAARQHRVAAGRICRAHRGTRPHLLYGQQVSREIPGRRVRRRARFVEPHRADRLPHHVHVAQARWHRGQDRSVRRWLARQGDRHRRGRPVDVAQMKDGSLLVSDDFAGAIYRIRYTGQ